MPPLTKSFEKRKKKFVYILYLVCTHRILMFFFGEGLQVLTTKQTTLVILPKYSYTSSTCSKVVHSLY